MEGILNIIPLTLSETEINRIVEDSTTTSNEALQCVICFENMEANSQVCKLACEHCFHEHCIRRWLSENTTCPVCRFNFSSPTRHSIIYNNPSFVCFNIQINSNNIPSYWSLEDSPLHLFCFINHFLHDYINVIIKIGDHVFKSSESFDSLNKSWRIYGIRGVHTAYVIFGDLL